MAVSLEAVVDEFGYGEAGPHAVRDFLAFAFHRWQPPSPRYVLLLGDASYDPKGRLAGTSRPDLIPSPFTKSTFLWTPADPLYAAVNGTDSLPDIAIGRINAATLAEAQAAVQKILDFENAGLTLSGKATLVADNPDQAGDFEANQDEIATLLPSRPVEKLFLTQLGAAATKAAVRSAFDTGVSLMSYVGHGSSGLWATEGILRSPDVAAFAPQPQQPLVLTMTCSNGYFVSPYNNSLSERLVLADGKGAIAVLLPLRPVPRRRRPRLPPRRRLRARAGLPRPPRGPPPRRTGLLRRLRRLPRAPRLLQPPRRPGNEDPMTTGRVFDESWGRR